MIVTQSYSRVNSIPAGAADSSLHAYSRVNSRVPRPRRTDIPSTQKAPDHRGFVVYGAVETQTRRESAMTVLPK